MFKAIFEFGPLLVWATLLFTVVRPLRLARRWSLALVALLLIGSQKFLIYRFLGGDSFVPELPEWFLTVTGWSYSASMLLFALSLAWLVARGVRPAWRPLSRWVIPVLAAVAMVVAGWGVWEGIRVPGVRHIGVAVQDLPPAFDGLRIVQLTDLHCSAASRKARTEGIVARVNELEPDLVCITGDFVDGLPEERAGDLAPLRGLKTKLGVFGCAGNHEYYSDYRAWRPVYESFGVTMLDNAHRVIERDGAKIALGGVTDPVAGHARLIVRAGRLADRMEPTNVRKAFAGAPADACRILLQHRPMQPKVNADLGVRLQLTGHTHGGAILGLDRLVARMGNNGFVRGLYQVGRMALYVSPGTGQWAGFPLRLGVSAEITEITLRRAPSKKEES
ncbi:MAG: metallophosphoesterase [Kiritimatiellia bacterium]